MNRTALLRLLAACAAVACGLLYLGFGEGTLVFVLPLMCLSFLFIAALTFREARLTGNTGFAVFLPAAAAWLAAIFAVIGTAVYFVSRFG